LRHIIRGTFEKLEERQVLAYQSIGAFTIPVKNDGWNTAVYNNGITDQDPLWNSPIFLDDKAEYLVKASGFAQMATSPQRLADAEYYQVRNTNGTIGPWEDMSLTPGATHNLGVRLKAANSTEQFFARWHDSYLPTMDHTYTRTIIGTGANLQTKFVDSNYADNANNQSDKLKVEVFGKITGDLDIINPFVAESNEDVIGGTMIANQKGLVKISSLRSYNAVGGFRIVFDASKIKLFHDADRTQEYESGTEFYSSADKTFFSLAITPGNTNIDLQWVPWGSGAVESLDLAKLTVDPITIDLDGDSNNDNFIDPINAGGTDDPIELTGNGIIVSLNNNDDDENGVLDYLQNTAVIGENDLRELQLSHNITQLTQLVHEVVLTLDSTNFKLYASPDKSGLITFIGGEKRWTIGGNVPVPEKLWIEAVSTGVGIVTTQIYQEGGAIIATDAVKVAAYGIDLIIDNQGDLAETELGSFVWQNSDFSKGISAATQSEAGITKYLPDYADPAFNIDPNYLGDFTQAKLIMPSEWVSTHSYKLQFDSSKIRIWSVGYSDGMFQVDSDWSIIKNGDPIHATDAEISIYIEGLSRSINTANILTYSVFDRNTTNSVIMKDTAKYSVIDVNLGVDGNRDNNIDFTNSYDKQLTFWYNNDQEGNHGEDGDYYVTDKVARIILDNSDATISNTRDLEDFARLNLFLDPLLVNSGFSDVKTFTSNPNTMSFRLGSSVEGAVQLYQAPTANGITNAHVLDLQLSKDQVENSNLNTQLSGINYHFITGLDDVSSFIFEGRGSGVINTQIYINVSFVYSNGITRTRYVPIQLELHDFKDFYSRYTIPMTATSRQDLSFVSYTDAIAEHTATTSNKPFLSGTERIVLVHGWNMPGNIGNDWKRAFSETAFKRLYWQGYRGQLVEFDWPTFSNEEGPRTPEELNMTFNMSEFQAWRSGKALMNLLASELSGKTHLLAHSMGNTVVASALRQWHQQSNSKLVESYVAMQAAISGGAYAENNTDAFTINIPDQFIGNEALSSISDWMLAANTSDHDLLRHFPLGSATTNTSSFAKSALDSAVAHAFNFYNPDDFAVSFAWEMNNAVTKNAEYLSEDLAQYLDSLLVQKYAQFFKMDGAGKAFPPTVLWPYRYVMENDANGVRHYYRVPYTEDGQFQQDRINWVDLTPGLVDNASNPGSTAFEILAFFSQANADAVGVDNSISSFVGVDISAPQFGMKTFSEDGTSLSSGHSFQFHHSAAITGAFWKAVKTKTAFATTY